MVNVMSLRRENEKIEHTWKKTWLEIMWLMGGRMRCVLSTRTFHTRGVFWLFGPLPSYRDISRRRGADVYLWKRERKGVWAWERYLQLPCRPFPCVLLYALSVEMTFLAPFLRTHIHAKLGIFVLSAAFRHMRNKKLRGQFGCLQDWDLIFQWAI